MVPVWNGERSSHDPSNLETILCVSHKSQLSFLSVHLYLLPSNMTHHKCLSTFPTPLRHLECALGRHRGHCGLSIYFPSL